MTSMSIVFIIGSVIGVIALVLLNKKTTTHHH